MAKRIEFELVGRGDELKQDLELIESQTEEINANIDRILSKSAQVEGEQFGEEYEKQLEEDFEKYWDAKQKLKTEIEKSEEARMKSNEQEMEAEEAIMELKNATLRARLEKLELERTISRGSALLSQLFMILRRAEIMNEEQAAAVEMGMSTLETGLSVAGYTAMGPYGWIMILFKLINLALRWVNYFKRKEEKEREYTPEEKAAQDFDYSLFSK
jgi:hypothetical protein